MRLSISDFIDMRLDAMLENPKFWGDAEAYELQVLLLLELKMALTNTKIPQESLRWILDQYYSFMRSRRPDSPPRPLSATLGEDLGQISAYLQEFREHLRGVVEAGSSREHVPNAPQKLGSDVKVGIGHSRMPRAA